MIVGIYGGSFDPIHTGHAIVTNFVAQCNVVDEVWLMVSRQNPLKKNCTIASDKQRLEMVSLVAAGCQGVKVTDVEITMPLPSYTHDTLLELKRRFPIHDFKIIIGSDSLENFQNWKNHQEIKKDFGVIVYPRPGYPMKGEEPEGFTFLQGAPEFSISSTLIREYVASGWNINYFVPLSVAEYIEKNKLYR